MDGRNQVGEEKVREVTYWLIKLNETIEENNIIIVKLRERIQGILKSVPVCGEIERSKEESLVPLAEEIRKAQNKLLICIMELREILETCEL